jgi:hypothetical protein
MTPQSNFTIIAPIIPEKLPALKELLERMKFAPGTPNACPRTANPRNKIVPFGKFTKLHYARFVILDDQTLDDFGRIGEPVPDYPIRLAFMGDCDGRADDVLADLAQRAGGGLRDVFTFCGLDADTDLLVWMTQHSVPAVAAYVNHVGRTVVQIHKDAALRKQLRALLEEDSPPDDQSARVTRENLLKRARAKRLIPQSFEPISIADKIHKFLDAISVPAAVGLVAVLVGAFLFALIAAICVVIWVAIGLWLPFPVALLALALVAAVLVFLVAARAYETAEPEIVARPMDAYTEMLAQDEDYDVVNQYSLIGSVKPTAFRRRMAIVNLWVINWIAGHWYVSGFLARIRTIHFARWVFLDDRRRVLFASSYDGSLESYNDDFINKGGFGLNFAFGPGLPYPRTRWVFWEGAKREQKFKYTLRRHQLTTQVWYNAYPGLTVYDLARNARVRDGVQRATMSDAKIREWLADL